ncbi:hypothetical protein BD410DRAFT_795193 [Rickenella mellea]|uniref:Uncharacterized protein n=1 Tax=Rickenella mellea TaxID=50990 RepID=A0A4Y7PMX7_9AGAM|nr:hypothetical protein BD410DRAFT_795193 [Rickenella mellea]
MQKEFQDLYLIMNHDLHFSGFIGPKNGTGIVSPHRADLEAHVKADLRDSTKWTPGIWSCLEG